MQEFPAALDYDCMTLTGRTLDEYVDMGPRGLVALSHFIHHLRPDSATWPLANDGSDYASWAITAKTNAILADIYDQIHSLRSEHAAKGTGKRPRRVKLYPRPGLTDTRTGFGTGDISVADFDAWWESN